MNVFVVWSCFGLTLVCAGCSQGEVVGKIEHDGKTVTKGTVQIQGPDGVPKSAILEADGTFRFQNLKPGDYRVSVSSPDPVEEAKQIAAQQRGKPGEPPPDPKKAPTVDASGWFPLPMKVESLETSGLTVTIKSGKNDVKVVIPK